ncbi:hypothetical protein ACGYLS_02925 [Bacillus subtilis]
MGNYYENQKLENIEHLKRIFPDGEANELNWCVLSTSGVHGLYRTLDDIENSDDEHSSITVLVIMPRIVSMLWGHIDITKEDIPYLRKLTNSSLRYIQESQKNNI